MRVPSLHRIVVAVLGVGLLASPAIADAPTKASVACETLPEVVLCAVRIEPGPRSLVKYAEASFVGTPKFVRPVRHKATYTYSPTKAPVLYLGLQPTGPGEGEIAVMVRSVSCANEEGACEHRSQAVRTTVSVPKR